MLGLYFLGKNNMKSINEKKIIYKIGPDDNKADIFGSCAI